MQNEIINRVANSKLITIDLEDYYPKGKRVFFDIKDWLFQEMIIKEKEFRTLVNNHNWEQYQNNFIAITCSVDAIIPSWATMLITTKLIPFAKKIVVGDLELLETVLFQEIINQLDISDFIDKPIIIKGCANKPIPVSAYTFLIEKVQPVAKSILFGEACSTVPLYKERKRA